MQTKDFTTLGKRLGYKEPQLVYHGSSERGLILDSTRYSGERSYSRDQKGTFFTTSWDHAAEFRFRQGRVPWDILHKVNTYVEYQTFCNSPKEIQKSMIKRGYKVDYKTVREGKKLHRDFGETYLALVDLAVLKEVPEIPEEPGTFARNVQDGLHPAGVFLLTTAQFTQVTYHRRFGWKTIK